MSKFALIGYGRMGQLIEKLARDRGHEITARFDEARPLTKEVDLNGAEALIDFSTAAAVKSNFQAASKLKIPIVEGTTGWQDAAKPTDFPKLTAICSPNFSIGVYVLNQLAEQAAQWLGRLGEYDAAIHEWHHRGKADSPSGTALMLAGKMLPHLPRKNEICTETCHEKIQPGQLHVTATRLGRIPGRHQIEFDSEFDSLTLEHSAHSRNGFAFGAIRAAEWILGRQGQFSMDDFMHDVLNQNE
ncbi:4-hydroxy-tetrahydrodipicolinate reductase [bacterium]|nr:4-hydroxy-tetrahydrodipicolinate reductase [bacterium]